ncbi:MAG: hypothetical protein H6721_25230 [Sandaracinus sp.]|nr:hypothetical protein [Sandaracinus sp.]
MSTYLFGDSSPFPDGHDFLAQLRTFVKAASRALLLAHEADQLEQNLGDRAQEHLHAIEALQGFFDAVTASIADRAARSGATQLVGPHARELLEHVERVAAHARQTRAQHLDADSVGVTTQIRDKRTELRDVLSKYFLADPLPTLGWALSLSLGGTAPHGQVLLTHPASLTTSFMIDVASDPVWSRPRKLGEISPGVTLQVGFKKAFLRSSLHPDVHTLDDFYVSELEIGPDSMELHLRRKPDAPRDAFVIDLDVGLEGQALARLTRRNEKGGESEAPYTSQGDDLERIQDLAETLRNECLYVARSEDPPRLRAARRARRLRARARAFGVGSHRGASGADCGAGRRALAQPDRALVEDRARGWASRGDLPPQAGARGPGGALPPEAGALRAAVFPAEEEAQHSAGRAAAGRLSTHPLH